MTYQIKALAELAGVSVRTLRYYDQIGLLKPAWIGENGYRYYENTQVNRLQQICLYRVMQIPLAEIKTLLDQPANQQIASLQRQYQTLLQERQHLDQLLTLVQTTIQAQREEPNMNDDAKFEAFKAAQLNENEQRYGDELKAQYDEATLKQSRAKFANLSAADYQKMQSVEAELLEKLGQLLATPTHDARIAKRVYQLHRQWLSYTWPKYTPAMHRGLAAMYQGDDRFKRYYDERAGVGATDLLVKIIQEYAQD